MTVFFLAENSQVVRKFNWHFPYRNSNDRISQANRLQQFGLEEEAVTKVTLRVTGSITLTKVLSHHLVWLGDTCAKAFSMHTNRLRNGLGWKGP